MRHEGAPLPILCLLFTSVPRECALSGAIKKESQEQFPGSVVALRALI